MKNLSLEGFYKFVDSIKLLPILSLASEKAFTLLMPFCCRHMICRLLLTSEQWAIVELFLIYLKIFQQRVLVDWKFSQIKSVCGLVYIKAVLGQLFFILYTANMLNDLENKIILYAADTTSYVKVTSPSDCINNANSLTLLTTSS